jgi:hypothetical protein
VGAIHRWFHLGPAMLLDRLAERAALGQLLDAARAGHGGALVVRGKPGSARPR